MSASSPSHPSSNADAANPAGEPSGRGGAPQHAGSAAPGLYIVATPIGNLRDITLRALDVLRAADAVYCEDTRVTGKLLHAYGIQAPMRSYHEHNAARRRPEIIKRLEDGAVVALVSDAGTPLISDPGYKLVRAVREAGLPVTAVPGPSAALAALTVAGLPTDRFVFQGFLPAKAKARREVLAELAGWRATLVVYESPRRLAASLAEMAEAFGPREAVVARELTKRFEELRRGSLAELAEAYATPPKGEVVIVVAPPPEAEAASAAEVDDRLRAALARLSPRDAAAEVARATGRPRKEVYARVVQLKEET